MKIHHIILLLLLAVLTACNSDIFVDDTDLPRETKVTIDGDGGQWITPYSSQGLQKISFSSDLGYDFHMQYYDRQGKPLTGIGNPENFGTIVCDSKQKYYSICFTKNLITVTSSFNGSYENKIMLVLEYESGATKYISITITAGTPGIDHEFKYMTKI